jgi:hypothetical protein
VRLNQSAWEFSRWGKVGDLRQATLETRMARWVREDSGLGGREHE